MKYTKDELIDMISPVLVAFLQDHLEEFYTMYGVTEDEANDTLTAIANLCDIEILED